MRDKMSPFIIAIQVEYIGGKTNWQIIDLTQKLRVRGISPTDFGNDYTSSSSSSGIPISGGQISFRDVNVSLTDNSTIQEPVSFNVRGRYDRMENLWNVDIYVDRHNYSLSEKGRRLITHHEDKIHKMKFNNTGDSEWIKIHWTLNGQLKPTIEGRR